MNKTKNIDVVILAAGLGSRLRPYTEIMPKCLTHVAGIPILENTIYNLKACGLNSISIVVGYKQEKIREFVASRFPNDEINFIINEEYAETGTAYSLQLGINSLLGYKGVLIIEGDVHFDLSLLQAFLESDYTDASAIARYQDSYSGSFVEIDHNLRIQHWVHESRRSKDQKIDNLFKTINIHSFSKDNVYDFLLKLIDENINTFGPKAPLEYVLADFIKHREVRGFIAEPHHLWYEVDNEDDLFIANNLFSQSLVNLKKAS